MIDLMKYFRILFLSARISRERLKIFAESHLQRLTEMRVDCDRDCLLVLVEQEGPACHTNRRSCFYTAVRDGAEVEILRPEA